MDYRPKIQEKNYGEMNAQIFYSPQTFSKMYEMAVKFSLQASHLGGYSKAALSNPSGHYMGKMPKDQINSDLNYKFPNRFSIN